MRLISNNPSMLCTSQCGRYSFETLADWQSLS